LSGVETTANQLEILSSVTTSPNSALRVLKVKKESPNTMLAELACRKPGQCLPFYVLIHQSEVEARAENKLLESLPGLTTAKDTIDTHPLVTRGQPVKLIIEKADFRIVLSAVCLEGGRHGQTIRVASPDRKRVYSAEVVSNTTVRSTL
jgi:hypothetical protein